MIDRKIIHVHDLAVEAETEFPADKAVQVQGIRTALAVPLLREGSAIGVIIVQRTKVQPFTERQVALLNTFADQAVIAIENVRLFKELTESLEQQTATSEILGVIASSPTDIQPVLDTVAKNAARVCGANDAGVHMLVRSARLRIVATYGSSAGSPVGTERPLNRDTVVGRVIVDRETIHIHDFLEVAADYPQSVAPQRGYRTMLGTPLLREGVPIGMIGIRRTEVRPFTEKQIALLKTFADQAVIAIENVRLFKELEARNRDLTEALEQQTATGEVLRVIASSPTELQPVLDTLIANAVKLSGATKGHVRQVDGEFLRVVAHYGESAEQIERYHSTPVPAVAGRTGRPGDDGEETSPCSRRSSRAVRFRDGSADGRTNKISSAAAARRGGDRSYHNLA